jgi:uncharacterized glyoxalase superfamily protein PhnB
MAVSYKPAEHQNVIPYLVVPDAEKEVRLLKEVFDATELHVSRDPQGGIAHASLKVGDSVVMLGQSSEQWPPLPCSIYVYVPDVDATYRRALAFGTKSLREPADQFYGDRSGGVQSGNGVQWWLGTHIEDVSNEEIHRRMQEMYKKTA